MSNIIDKIQVSGITYDIGGGGGSVTVDTELDSGSTNPVQNKVIYNKIDEVEEVTAAGLNALNDKITPTVELTQAQYDALVDKDPNTYYIITDAQAGDLTNYYTKSETNTLLGGKADTATTYTKTEVDNAITAATSTKQDTLVSGTNIKTINNTSLLGSGNIDIQGGGKAVSGGTNISITTGETADTINCTLSGGTLINISNSKINCTAPIRNGTGINSVIVGTSISTNKASGLNSIVNGGDANTASGQYSFAEGFNTQATKHSSHSEGWFTIASGNYSHTEGNHTKTTNESEHASGKYNASSSASTTFGDSGNTLFSVGNGTSNNARHNAFEIRQNGDIYLTKDGQDVKLQDQLGGSSITVDSALSSTSENPVQNKVIYNKIDEVEQVTAAGLNTLNESLSGKQDTLSAGTNITISGNVISAEGGGLTEDDELLLATALTDLNDRKIDASEVKSNYQKKGDYVTTNALNTRLAEYETKANVEQVEKITAYALNDLNQRFGGLKITKITESEYAALTTKDENTLYIVIADPS